jgi:nucleotide-binding universal stress UspA family protein
MFSNILVATDGSPVADRAVQLAVDLARMHKARLTAVYVVDPYPYLGIGEANPLGFQAYMSAAHAHAAEAHTKVEALCSSGDEPVPLELRLVENASAASGIVQVAKDENADLIVIGSHGRTGIARVMLGSVAAKVLANATVPVLVAR